MYQLAHKQKEFMCKHFAMIIVIFGADKSHGCKAIQIPPVVPETSQVLRNLRAKLSDRVQERRLHAQLAATKQQESVAVGEGWCSVKACWAPFALQSLFSFQLTRIHQ
jgi:hypothetical protein